MTTLKKANNSGLYTHSLIPSLGLGMELCLM